VMPVRNAVRAPEIMMPPTLTRWSGRAARQMAKAAAGNREIAKIFAGLCKRFNKANVKAERSYHFALGAHESWTVVVRRDGCVVRQGPDDGADVYFEGPAELFLDVWNGRHQLGALDFLTGRVKSNQPLALRDFVAAFQKPARA